MRYKRFQKSTISGSVRFVFILFFQLLRNFKIKIGLNMQSVLTFFFLLDIKVGDQRMIPDWSISWKLYANPNTDDANNAFWVGFESVQLTFDILPKCFPSFLQGRSHSTADVDVCFLKIIVCISCVCFLKPTQTNLVCKKSYPFYIWSSTIELN